MFHGLIFLTNLLIFSLTVVKKDKMLSNSDFYNNFETNYFAQEPADIITRRSSFTYAMKHYDKKGVLRVAKIMAEELSINNEWVESQVEKYYAHWQEYHPNFIF